MRSNVVKGDFSMAQIDEVSSKLGGIEATQAHILKSIHAIERIFKDTSEKTIVNTAKIDAARARLDRLEPIVQDYQTARDKGKGMLYVLSTLWAAVVGFVSFVISKIFLP